MATSRTLCSRSQSRIRSRSAVNVPKTLLRISVFDVPDLRMRMHTLTDRLCTSSPAQRRCRIFIASPLPRTKDAWKDRRLSFTGSPPRGRGDNPLCHALMQASGSHLSRLKGSNSQPTSFSPQRKVDSPLSTSRFIPRCGEEKTNHHGAFIKSKNISIPNNPQSLIPDPDPPPSPGNLTPSC